MKPLIHIALIMAFAFFSSVPTYAAPKVTQAALIDFKVNHVTALAVEDFSRPSTLKLLNDKDIVYSTDFNRDYQQ